MSTRDRKLAFMREFGPSALGVAVERAFRRNGPDWLTDEQLDQIVRDQITDWRFSQRINLRNRRRMAAKAEQQP